MKLSEQSAYPMGGHPGNGKGFTKLEAMIASLASNSNLTEMPNPNLKEGLIIYERNASRIINQAEAILAELDRRNANK